MTIADLIEKANQEIKIHDTIMYKELNKETLLQAKRINLSEKKQELFEEGARKIKKVLEEKELLTNKRSYSSFSGICHFWNETDIEYYYNNSTSEGFIVKSVKRKFCPATLFYGSVAIVNSDFIEEVKKQKVHTYLKYIENIKKKDFQRLYNLDKAHFYSSKFSYGFKKVVERLLLMTPGIYDMMLSGVEHIIEKKHSVKEDREAILPLLKKYNL